LGTEVKVTLADVKPARGNLRRGKGIPLASQSKKVAPEGEKSHSIVPLGIPGGRKRRRRKGKGGGRTAPRREKEQGGSYILRGNPKGS